MRAVHQTGVGEQATIQIERRSEFMPDGRAEFFVQVWPKGGRYFGETVCMTQEQADSKLRLYTAATGGQS